MPEVELATGAIYDETSTKILQPDGDAVSTGGAPSFGFGIDTSEEYARFNPLNLQDGRWPSEPGEVVIDAGTVEKQDFALGDMVEIATLVPKRPFELVGVAQYGGVNSIGTATFAVFTIPQAQELLDREGQYDSISVAAKDEVEEEALVAAIEDVLPAGAAVQSATAEADEAQDEIGEFTSIIRVFLLTFAGVSLFVGAFVIFNTFSITVAQRTREFATLRTIGASRRQVLAAVILESLAIGLVASLIGLALGLLLAEGIQALFRLFDFELPSADRVFALRTVIVSMAVGVLVTLAAGLFPAIRATRVPPIAAVREGATLPRSRIARFAPWIAGLVTAGALALLARGLFTDDLGTSERLISLGVGVLLLFIGVAVVSPHVVPAIAIVTSPIGRWAAFVLTALAWPTWLLPMWLLKTLVWGPGTTLRRVLAGVGGVLLAVAGAAVAIGLSTAEFVQRSSRRCFSRSASRISQFRSSCS